jgi:hypothetical protein
MDALNHRPAKANPSMPEQPDILLRHAKLAGEGVDAVHSMLGEKLWCTPYHCVKVTRGRLTPG